MSHNSKQIKSDSKSHSVKRGSKPEIIKKESKSEQQKEKIKSSVSSVKKISQNERYRSESLSRRESVKLRESPRKAQSVDRNQANRNNLSSQVAKKEINKNAVRGKAVVPDKSTSTSSSRSSTKAAETSISKKASTSRVSTTKKNPSSEKSQKMVKATERKTNVEIAKSFVKKKSDSKPKKIIKPTENENQISNVQKINSSKQYPDQDSAVERPRTSTIRKDSEPGYIVPEIDEKATGNVVPNNGIFVPNNKDNLDAESDDEKASYEEDFEDYDSDFEDSATDSVPESGNENESLDDEEDSDTLHSDGETNNLTENFVMPKLFGVDTSKGQVRKVEKTFLNMSDRSSLFSNKESIPMADVRPIKVSRSFINFASAVEQEKKKKFNNKVMKRASDLLEIITPDVMSFEVINIPPMKYETYIRTFGKSDTKQAFVQTENFEEEEVQTDEIEMLNKWTQNPPNDNLGYGGDNVRNTMNESENWKSLFADHSVKLSSFLQRSSSVILTLLDEEFPPFSAQSSSLQRSNLFFSDSYNILSPVNFLKDIPVVNVSCCSESDRFIITIHDSMVKLPCSEDFIKEKGIMCVWNLCNRQMPEYILMANSQPTCATFGMGSDIVIGGMVDGAVMLWDLKENNLNHSKVILNEQFVLKSPAYNTASILGNENHSSCVVAVKTVCNYAKQDLESAVVEQKDYMKSFHVLTLEDMGVINVWVVVEVLKPDISGFETELGLAPGGKYKLVRSSCLPFYHLSTLQLNQKTSIRTFDFCLVPSDPSRILVTTDIGIVLHATRHSGIPEPRFYSSESEFSSEVRCIDCSPHNEDLFLVRKRETNNTLTLKFDYIVGCSDGIARLYNIKSARPVMVFLQVAKGDPVTLLQWSPIHPVMFCALSSSSSLYLWNLMEDSLHPIRSYHFEDSRVTWLAFRNIEKNYGDQTSERFLNMLISKENGEVEVHMYQEKVTKEEYLKQIEFMQNL